MIRMLLDDPLTILLSFAGIENFGTLTVARTRLAFDLEASQWQLRRGCRRHGVYGWIWSAASQVLRGNTTSSRGRQKRHRLQKGSQCAQIRRGHRALSDGTKSANPRSCESGSRIFCEQDSNRLRTCDNKVMSIVNRIILQPLVHQQATSDLRRGVFICEILH